MGRKGRTTRSEDILLCQPHQRDLARLLDFYGVPWEPEPVTFALSWDDGGVPTSVFRPAFWLPEHGRFIDVAIEKKKVMAQKAVALGRMRALYPEIDVKIFSPKAYQDLVDRRLLGRVSPAAAMLCG